MGHEEIAAIVWSEAGKLMAETWNYSPPPPCTDTTAPCTNIRIIANTRANPILGAIVLELLVVMPVLKIILVPFTITPSDEQLAVSMGSMPARGLFPQSTNVEDMVKGRGDRK